MDRLLEQTGWLRQLAYSLVFDESVADDAMQEAWLAALRSGGPRGKGEGVEKSWLKRVLKRRLGEEQRAEQVRRKHEGQAQRDRDSGEPLEAHALLIRALRRLPEPYRSSVVERYFEGRSPKDIAAAEGKRPEVIRTRLHRALGMLREELDRETGRDRHAWALMLLPIARVPESIQVANSLAVAKLSIVGIVLLGLISYSLWAFLGDDEEDDFHISEELALTPSAPRRAPNPIPVAPPPVAKKDPLPRKTEKAQRRRRIEKAGFPLVSKASPSAPIKHDGDGRLVEARTQLVLKLSRQLPSPPPIKTVALNGLDVLIEAAHGLNGPVSLRRGHVLDGLVVFENVPPVEWWVQVAGYDPRRVRLQDKPFNEIELILPVGVRVQGHVRRSDGSPIGDAVIHGQAGADETKKASRDRSFTTSLAHAIAKSDEHGRFEGIVEDFGMTIAARVSGFAPPKPALMKKPDRGASLAEAFRSGGLDLHQPIFSHDFEIEGKPAAALNVKLSGVPDDGRQELVILSSSRSKGAKLRGEAGMRMIPPDRWVLLSGAHMAELVDDLEPGRVVLQTTSPSRGYFRSVKCKAGTRRERSVTPRLGLRLSGIARGPDGTRIKNAEIRVWLRDTRGSTKTFRAADDGSFDLRGLLSGNVEFTLRDPGGKLSLRGREFSSPGSHIKVSEPLR